MKSIRSSMLLKVAVLAIAALAAYASPAQAQSATGKFTLTHETHWGKALLPPGVYSLALQSSNLPAVIMVGKTGAPQIAIVMPASVSVERRTAGSTLLLNRTATGESFVSALYLGDLGLSLHYLEPKSLVAAEPAKLGTIAESQPVK